MPRHCTLCVVPTAELSNQSVFTLNAVYMLSTRVSRGLSPLLPTCALVDNSLRWRKRGAQSTAATPLKAFGLFIGMRTMFCCHK